MGFGALEVVDVVEEVVKVEVVDAVVTGIHVFSILEWCFPEETGN